MRNRYFAFAIKLYGTYSPLNNDDPKQEADKHPQLFHVLYYLKGAVNLLLKNISL
jgi:hypothetical protein